MSAKEAMLDLWYKSAVVYCLDVDTFADGNGDGVGDFEGLTQRLDYLAGLGVTCLWLLPFYPSPNRDNGYDVTDHYGVHPLLGSAGDFVQFSRRAHERGMKIVVDLVVNHTSNEHPWFRMAREDPSSPYRDFYVWSERKPPDAHKGVIFPGVQKSIWSYDRVARAYYLHRFYAHQPDLNVANPRVRDEIQKVMGYWLELGVSGFRVDAAPFLIEHLGVEDSAEKDPFAYLDQFREFLSWRRGDAILLAEANVGMNEIVDYFGQDGGRMHMLFNFLVNQYVFLTLVQGRSEPLVRALRQLPATPPTGQWANFLRNHDEIDLGRLSDEERQQVFAFCGPEPEMQLYGRGIRRRLAPMLRGDQRRLRLAWSLMFSLPGTPVIWYGDEIGMGDDLSLPERNSVRTPMQWSDEGESGGFSTAPRKKLIRPIVSGGEYGSEHVNVLRQQRDPDSLLNHVERLIRTRKECPEIGWGPWRVLETDRPGAFAHRCDWQGKGLIALHNLAESPCTVRVKDRQGELTGLAEILSDGSYEPVRDLGKPVLLEGYGFRWFRATSSGRPI